MNQTIERAGVKIDINTPWAQWPEPEIRTAKVKEARVETTTVGGSQRLILRDDIGDIGLLSQGGMREMSTYCQYPTDFVEKLPIELQAEVITARMAVTKAGEMSFTGEPFEIVEQDGSRRWSDTKLVTNVAPGWRGVVPHAAVAQTTYDLMTAVYGPNLEVKLADRYDNIMRLRIVGPTHETITRHVGDVLRAGLEITHQYGVELSARLYTERLVCLNGMTSTDTRFTWQSGRMGSIAQQLDFLNLAVWSATEAFGPLVERARLMAEAEVDGDPEQVLLERAKAMRIPGRHHRTLVEMFRQEPIRNEWGFLNAFTRLATHGQTVTPAIARSIMDAAGKWVEGFDIVSARIPRPIAESIGAHIYEDTNYTGAISKV